MNWPRYPEYKDSGVEWLGEVPVGWEVLPLKRFISMKSGEQISADNIQAEGDYPVYGGNGLRGYTDKYTHEGFYPLIGRQGALCGNINYASGKFWPSEHAVVVFPKLELNILWLGNLLKTMNLGQYSIASAQPGLAVEAISQRYAPFLPHVEQQSIAAFLEHETTKIDSLIAEQEKLITLLTEKRQAVISHAVTKGLDPDALMKDFGVEWLGMVPEEWEILPLRHIVSGIESGTSVNAEDRPADTDELGVLKTSCVYTGTFVYTENKSVLPEEYDRVSCPLKKNTIIVSRMNTPDLVGAAGFVAEQYSNIFLPDRLWQVTCCTIANPVFIYIYMQTNGYRSQVKSVCSGTSSSMQNLSQDQFRDFVLALPPLSEQQAIVAHLDSETAKIDALMAEARKAVELLKERRSALISAAVTGKIDVRGFKLPEAV